MQDCSQLALRFLWAQKRVTTKSSKAHKCGRKNRRRKIEKEVRLLGSTMSVLLSSYISSLDLLIKPVFSMILVRLWVPPPTLASSACHSASCRASKQWPAQDHGQRWMTFHSSLPTVPQSLVWLTGKRDQTSPKWPKLDQKVMNLTKDEQQKLGCT